MHHHSLTCGSLSKNRHRFDVWFMPKEFLAEYTRSKTYLGSFYNLFTEFISANTFFDEQYRFHSATFLFVDY
jgi:hypothetical protein